MDQQERQERERLYGMLREALETHLTDMQRRRLWMYYVEDLTIEEIAAEENVKHQNIFKRILTAKKILKKYLEKGVQNQSKTGDR